MFNIGGGEILVILLVALIVLGPQRLPEAARKVGTIIGEVRRMANGFQTEIKSALEEAELTDRPARKPVTPSPDKPAPTRRVDPAPPALEATTPEPSPPTDDGPSDAVA